MKNTSGAMYVIAPLLIVLIIGASAFMYSSAQSTVNDSMNQLSTQEIEAFNSLFMIYGGEQTGTKLKALLGTLIANANTYSNDIEKIPEVTAEVLEGEEKTAKRPEEAGETEEYISVLAEIRNKFENKHAYSVEFEYSDGGLMNKIIIKY